MLYYWLGAPHTVRVGTCTSARGTPVFLAAGYRSIDLANVVLGRLGSLTRTASLSAILGSITSQVALHSHLGAGRSIENL